MSDSKDNIWISSSDGIKVYYKDMMEIVEFKKDTKIPNYLSSNVITCFYEDINGVIWIGTDRGVNILSGNKQFNNTIRNAQGDGLLYDKEVMSILQHGEQIWIATKFNGIYIYNKDGDLITHLDKNDSEINLNDNYIKNMFSQDFMLRNISVKGEISNCKYHTSGHIYFTIKDAAGTISPRYR